MSFFNTVDTGVTLNRFSQDITIIDSELPLSLLNTVASECSFCVSASPTDSCLFYRCTHVSRSSYPDHSFVVLACYRLSSHVWNPVRDSNVLSSHLKTIASVGHRI